MKKITLLSTAYPLRGGIAHFTGLLYKALSQKYYTNVVTFKRQYPRIFFPGKTQVEGDEVEKIPTEVIVDSINPFNWIKVGRKIKKEKPELLIFKYWMPFFAPCFGTITRIARKNGVTKTLVICDNVIPHERKPGDVFFTRFFFKKVDFFITMSKSVTNDLLRIKPAANYKMLFHPVYVNFGHAVPKDEARKRLKIKDEKVILFFGFIRDYKGLDVLLKAIALLKDKLQLKALIAGEFYTDREKYFKLIKELEIENMLLMQNDFIPTSEVKYYFSAADVVVLPYKDATQSGIVQIANNFNKPVIVTDVGGLGEIVHDGKTGYVVEKENPQKLAEKILEFYSRQKEEEFSNNVRREREKYSWESFVESLEKLTGLKAEETE